MAKCVAQDLIPVRPPREFILTLSEDEATLLMDLIAVARYSGEIGLHIFSALQDAGVPDRGSNWRRQHVDASFSNWTTPAGEKP